MTSFINSSGMNIPDGGTAIQTVPVTGLAGAITSLSVSIGGLTHTFPDDLDFLLVAPDGTHNLEFWSNAGGGTDVAGINVTVADTGGVPLPDTGPLAVSIYQPADYQGQETGLDFGPSLGALNHPATNGTDTLASAFNGIDPNGVWTLYVKDDFFGDVGSLTSWALNLTTGGTVVVNGTLGADTLVINATGPDSGQYTLNGGTPVDFSGVTSFTFNGFDGNDSVVIQNPSSGVFAPTDGIFINGGHESGPPGDTLSITGGSSVGGKATYDFGPTPDAGTITTNSPEVEGLSIFGATTGTFSLSFDGQTTAPLPATATAAQIEAALNALSSIGGVGGSVAVVPSGGGAFMITFGGSLATTAVPLINGSADGGTTFVTSLVQEGSAPQSIHYGGLEPISNSGSATDVVFNLTAGADQAVLEDNGSPGDDLSQLRSANGTFETTVFTDPSSSLTVNAGAGDTVAVDLVDNLVDLNIGSLTDPANRPDSISVNNLVAGGTVHLAATGDITQTGIDITPDITADRLALLAGTGIGDTGTGLDLQVSTLAANTSSGPIMVDNAGTLVIGSVDGVDGLTGVGPIEVNTLGIGPGDLTVDSNVTTNAGNIFLAAGGTGDTLSNHAAIAAGGANGVGLEADRMALAGGTISSGVSVTLQQFGASAIDLGSATDLAPGTLELSDAELDTVSAPILRIGQLVPATITISGPISADTHYQILTLITGGAIADGTPSEQPDLTVDQLELIAASGIGAAGDLNTQTTRLDFSNDAGAVEISNVGPLTIGDVEFLSGSVNNGTITRVATTGPMTVESNVTSASDLLLIANDSASSGDLTILSGATLHSTGGNVVLFGGDDIVLGSGASITAAGSISITVDIGSADPGTGGTIDVRQGTMLASSGISLLGGGDDDTLFGGAASESLSGGSGGNDLIAPGGGNNTVNGGPGNDTVDYSAAPGAVSIDVASGGSNGYGGIDSFSNVENVNGSAFADTLTGDGNANALRGNGGDDQLFGGGGSDTAAYAGNAADYQIEFLPGTDLRVIDLRSGSPDGTDTLHGFAALQFADGSMPVSYGTAGDDSFTAPSGFAAINAGSGTDTISFNFRLVDATFTWLGDTVVVDTPTSHTVLDGFETFVFTDGTVNNHDADPLVDDLFYYSQNHDVWTAHLDADQHYHQLGWQQGHDPNAFFSTSVYLSVNPDVKAAGVDPLLHFAQSGWLEGRSISLDFDPRQYLAANPDVAAAHANPLAHFLADGAGEGRQPVAPTELFAANGFDYIYYLQHNPDVAAAHVDPLLHFETVGWKEGRNPNALFDVNGYLATYTDVAAAGVNPLDHYHQTGWHEGRDPSVNFDTTSYLATYHDVAAAQVDPLLHFLQSGIHEGRSPFADGVWG